MIRHEEFELSTLHQHLSGARPKMSLGKNLVIVRVTQGENMSLQYIVFGDIQKLGS